MIVPTQSVKRSSRATTRQTKLAQRWLDVSGSVALNSRRKGRTHNTLSNLGRHGAHPRRESPTAFTLGASRFAHHLCQPGVYSRKKPSRLPIGFHWNAWPMVRRLPFTLSRAHTLARRPSSMRSRITTNAEPPPSVYPNTSPLSTSFSTKRSEFHMRQHQPSARTRTCTLTTTR